MCGIGSMIYFLLIFVMLADVKMRYRLYPFSHLVPLNDVGSLASWMSVRSHECPHCSTASPLSLWFHNPRR